MSNGENTKDMGTPGYYVINNEKEIQRIDLGKNLVLRLIEKDGQKYINISKFYKGYPTKKNIEIDYKTYQTIKNLIN